MHEFVKRALGSRAPLGSRALQWVLLFLLCSACASKKYIVTLPQKDVGDEMATQTLEPCAANSKDPDACVLQINDCPTGIGRLKVVRKKGELQVTPYCRLDIPEDPPPQEEPCEQCGSGGTSPADGSTGGTSPDDPGDL